MSDDEHVDDELTVEDIEQAIDDVVEAYKDDLRNTFLANGADHRKELRDSLAIGALVEDIGHINVLGNLEVINQAMGAAHRSVYAQFVDGGAGDDE